MPCRVILLKKTYAFLKHIEANTMIMMARRQILPAVLRFTGDIAASARSIRDIGIDCFSGSELVSSLSMTVDQLSRDLQMLESVLSTRPDGDDPLVNACYMHDTVLPAMANLRKSADRLETLTDRSYWPFPTYDELLFSI